VFVQREWDNRILKLRDILTRRPFAAWEILKS